MKWINLFCGIINLRHIIDVLMSFIVLSSLYCLKYWHFFLFCAVCLYLCHCVVFLLFVYVPFYLLLSFLLPIERNSWYIFCKLHAILTQSKCLCKIFVACFSSSLVDWSAPGHRGVFWSVNSIPIPSGGCWCVGWSQRCHSLSTTTYSAAAEDTPRYHSDKRQQKAEFGYVGAYFGCCSDRLDFLSSPFSLLARHRPSSLPFQ